MWTTRKNPGGNSLTQLPYGICPPRGSMSEKLVSASGAALTSGAGRFARRCPPAIAPFVYEATTNKEEKQAIYRDYQAINQTPGVTPGVQMQPPEMATTVRVENGTTLTTDGPFVATKEALGGYLFFEADDLDAAIELGARIPAARLGGAIEVRPLAE